MNEEAIRNYPITRFFAYDHLPERLQEISSRFADLAELMATAPRNAETSAGLRKLLEAKDCAVRAALMMYNMDLEGKLDLPKEE